MQVLAQELVYLITHTRDHTHTHEQGQRDEVICHKVFQQCDSDYSRDNIVRHTSVDDVLAAAGESDSSTYQTIKTLTRAKGFGCVCVCARARRCIHASVCVCARAHTHTCVMTARVGKKSQVQL